MHRSTQEIKAFRQKIFTWWKRHRRDLPWRRTSDPYRIMISEVMLQQTQVSRVVGKYREFIDVYPDVSALAAASTADVLKRWKGMGYNRRALFLKKAAEVIVERYGGIFPDTESELLTLPGIGRYTARAILVFSFQKDVAMVDTNVRKIITHAFFNNEKQPERTIEAVAGQLVPRGKSWAWHQALMDYGALQLKEETKKNPRAETKTRKSAPPFKQSVRFFRGRIMDFLREHDETEIRLVAWLKDEHGRSEAEVEQLLNGLLSDGLIVRSGNDIMRLPE